MPEPMQYILHVEDEAYYHRRLLALLERAAVAKGVPFDEVKKRVVHATDYYGGVEFLRNHDAEVAVVFIDNQLGREYRGKDLVNTAYNHPLTRLLVWASSSAPDDHVREYVHVTGKRGLEAASDPRVINDETFYKLLTNQPVDEHPLAREAVKVASEAIDRLGITLKFGRIAADRTRRSSGEAGRSA